MFLSKSFLYGDYKWGNNTKKHLVFQEDAEQLNEVLSELINENEEFSMFINSISFTSISSTLRKNFLRKLCISPLDITTGAGDRAMAVEHQTEISDDNRNDVMWTTGVYNTISFCDFGLKALETAFACSDYSSSNSRLETKLLKSYDPMFRNSNISVRNKCINIDSKMKGFTGSFINMNSIISLYESYTRNGKDIDKFVLIGTTNVLLGIIFNNGTLVIRWPALKQILKKHDREVFKSTLCNLLNIFVPYNLRFQAMNMEGYKKELLVHAFAKANLEFSTFMFKKDDDEPKELFKERVETVVKTCTDYIDRIVKSKETSGPDFVTGLVNELLSRVRDDIREFKEDAYGTGYKYGAIMANSGWHIADTDKLAWYKSVDITPDRFIFEGRMYKIPKDKRTVHISEITIFSAGNMTATNDGVAHHPNMSGQRVCTGDMELAKLTTGDPEQLMSLLNSAEKLLEIINFDSAYTTSMLQSIYYNITPESVEGSQLSLRKDLLDDPTRRRSGLKRQLTRKNDAPKKTENVKKGKSLPKAGVLPKPEEVAKQSNDENAVYVEQLSNLSRVVRDIERGIGTTYRTIKVANLLTNVNNAIWLHPNGVTIIGLRDDVGYAVPFYKRARNIQAVEISDTDLNKMLPLCKLVQVGLLNRTDWKGKLTRSNFAIFKRVIRSTELNDRVWKDMWTYCENNKTIEGIPSPFHKSFYDMASEMTEQESIIDEPPPIPANSDGLVDINDEIDLDIYDGEDTNQTINVDVTLSGTGSATVFSNTPTTPTTTSSGSF